MPIRQKFENEIEQLMKVINTLNIPIQNIIILKQNFSISEIIELINRCDTTFITSKTDSINLELYITLLLNKPVIVSNNYEVLPEFLSKVIYLKPINQLGFVEDNSNTDYDQLYSLYSKDEIENLLSSVKRMNCTNQFSLAENEIQDILNKIFL